MAIKCEAMSKAFVKENDANDDEELAMPAIPAGNESTRSGIKGALLNVTTQTATRGATPDDSRSVTCYGSR